MRRQAGTSGVMSLCLVALLAFVGATGTAPQPAAAAEAAVTYTKHIAPIIQRSCESCHRQGGFAPMSLTTYDEVRPWARAIKQKTSTREMPPWFIEPDVGVQHFKNDPSLSAEEIEMVAHWVDSGAPRGHPADMPPAREYLDRTQWAIGEPDLIVEGPQVLVKAVAPDYHRELGPVATGLAEDRYIAAVEVKETRLDGSAFRNEKGSGLNLFALHHAGIRELGFDMDAPDGFYLIYEVGQNATFYPADYRRPPAGRLGADLHRAYALGRPRHPGPRRCRVQVPPARATSRNTSSRATTRDSSAAATFGRISRCHPATMPFGTTTFRR